MPVIQVVMTLEYTEDHPIYIDAQICFYSKKVRRYQIENAKLQLLYKLDYLFNPEITNMMNLVGIERIHKKKAEKQGLDCPEYPESHIVIIWKHKDDERPSKYDEYERIDV